MNCHNSGQWHTSITDYLGIVTSHVTLEQAFHCSLIVTVWIEQWSSARRRCHGYVDTGYRVHVSLLSVSVSSSRDSVIPSAETSSQLIITDPHSDTKTCYDRQSHQRQEYQRSCPLLYFLLARSRSLTRPVYETRRVS